MQFLFHKELDDVFQKEENVSLSFLYISSK